MAGLKEVLTRGGTAFLSDANIVCTYSYSSSVYGADNMICHLLTNNREELANQITSVAEKKSDGFYEMNVGPYGEPARLGITKVKTNGIEKWVIVTERKHYHAD